MHASKLMSSRVGIALLLVGICSFATLSQQPPASPRKTVEATVGGKKVSLDYGAPSARGRQIFGALVPYDKVWRFGANKATHFIAACCQSRTPILYLNNTTGFMVGKEHEQGGIIKHGSKMIQAVTNATVPQITLYCGASFGAGNYGTCGRGFAPRFCFSWPNARTAVMGPEQAAETMALVTAAAMQRKTGQVDEGKIAALKAGIVERFERQMSVLTTSALLLDDGVIDPRDTRAVLAEVLAICREAEARTPQRLSFGVMRP